MITTAFALVLSIGCTDSKDDTSSAADDSSATDDSGPADDSSATDDSATPPDDSGTGPTTVVVNELLALNNTINTDENDEYEDWVELYNTGKAPVDLEGFGLTDDPDVDKPWTFPAGNTIAPGGYVLVWADGENGDGPLHASFKLGGDGESVTLLDPAGNVIDLADYSDQVADVSWARHPDGGETWKPSTPTPMASNL
jgi:large repetitive protein